MEFPVYEDEYDDGLDYADHTEDAGAGLDDFHMSELPIENLWHDCILEGCKGTLYQLFLVVASCIAFSIFRVVIWRLFIPKADLWLHFFSALLGCSVWYWAFEDDSQILVLFAVTCCGVYRLLVEFAVIRYRGLIMAVFAVSHVVIYEMFFGDPVVVHRIRGGQMILLMKVISIPLDSPASPVFLSEYFGYCFHVGNVFFGPWISLKTYRKIIYEQPTFSSFLGSLLNCIVSFACSAVALILSTCLLPWIDLRGFGKWARAYQDAVGFRTSHYFVCYMSEATIMASGVERMSVVKPWKIELPRSLVEVVAYWNIPMRNWLKTNVFLTVRQSGGVPLALGMRYFVSSLLHGLNFQLSAVLLSLALFTYAEHNLRRKLAMIFDACIEARPCRDCKHFSRSSTYLVRATNTGFGIVAIIQLAYLGVMFDTSEQAEEGFGYEHTLRKWSELNYAGHYIGLTAFVIQYLL